MSGKKDSTVGFLLIFTAIFARIAESRIAHFKKLLATADPEYPDLFTALSVPAPKAVKYTTECARYASWSSELTNKSERASAFVFANDTCTLGKTPVFLDEFESRDPIPNGINGVQVLDGIKTTSAVAHEGMFAYILLNEEKQFYKHRHEILTNPPNPAQWDANNDPFDYLLDSPVQTFGGSKAVKYDGTSFLEYAIAPKQWTQISVLIWYNPGSSSPHDEPLFLINNPENTAGNSGFQAWAGYFGIGNMRAGIFKEQNGVPDFTHPKSAQTIDNAINANTWCYLGYAFDGVAGKFAFYLNGTRIGNEHSDVLNYQSTLSHMGEINIGKYDDKRLDNHLASVEVYEIFLEEQEVQDYFLKSTTSRVNPT